jgi:hypothetical protein
MSGDDEGDDDDELAVLDMSPKRRLPPASMRLKNHEDALQADLAITQEQWEDGPDNRALNAMKHKPGHFTINYDLGGLSNAWEPAPLTLQATGSGFYAKGTAAYAVCSMTLGAPTYPISFDEYEVSAFVSI